MWQIWCSHLSSCHIPLFCLIVGLFLLGTHLFLWIWLWPSWFPSSLSNVSFWSWWQSAFPCHFPNLIVPCQWVLLTLLIFVCSLGYPIYSHCFNHPLLYSDSQIHLRLLWSFSASFKSPLNIPLPSQKYLMLTPLFFSLSPWPFFPHISS